MNNIIYAKKLIKLAKKILSTNQQSLYILDQKNQKKYRNLVDNLINQINEKIKTFNLPFDYELYLQDNMIYDNYDEYEQTCQDNDMFDICGKSLCSYMWDINVLPVIINIPFLYSQIYFGNMSLNDVQKQIEITLWHELAHGLIQRFEDEQIQIPFSVDDQHICQQFGRACGELNKSKFGRFINNFIKQNNQ